MPKKKNVKGAASESMAAAKRTRQAAPRSVSSQTPDGDVFPDDPSSSRSTRLQNRQETASEKEIGFLRDRVSFLKDKVDEYKDLVARLTHEIRAEDGAYRQKYSSTRRELNRLKKKLADKAAIADADLVQEAEEDHIIAPSLLALANEAMDFLAAEIEAEAAEASQVDEEVATRADACASAYPEEEQVAHDSSHDALLRANPFSPLADMDANEAEGDTEASPGHPLEPEQPEQRSEIRAAPLNRLETPSFQDRLQRFLPKSKRPLASPLDRRTPPKRAPSGARPPPVPPPPSKCEAHAQTDTRAAISMKTQTYRITGKNAATHTKKVFIHSDIKKGKLPRNASRHWISRRAKLIEGMLSDYIIRESSWK